MRATMTTRAILLAAALAFVTTAGSAASATPLAAGESANPLVMTPNNPAPGQRVTLSDHGGCGTNAAWGHVDVTVVRTMNSGNVDTKTVLATTSALSTAGRWGPLRFTVPGDTARSDLFAATATCVTQDSSTTVTQRGFIVQPTTKQAYVALGDSYSSGEGNPPFDAGTATSTDTCHRSSKAWARGLSSTSASLSLTQLIACSGAEISALTQSFNSEPPQLTQLAALPAQQQLTITIGGNDLGFSDILTDCFIKNCVSDGTLAAAEAALPALAGQLTQAYQSIQTAEPTAALTVVGYPNIFPTSQSAQVTCGWLSSQERPALVTLATDLDATIQTAAGNAGAGYVSTLGVLAGHEECTQVSWMYPINLTGGQLRGHPTANGQNAIKVAVQAILG